MRAACLDLASSFATSLRHKLRRTAVLATVVSIPIIAASASLSIASPLDVGSWYQVARMSDSDAGMFDGNSNLASDYSFGTYTGVGQADDFYRPFDVYDGMEILFITGNEDIWAKTSYSTLKSLVDANAGEFGTNIRVRHSSWRNYG